MYYSYWKKFTYPCSDAMSHLECVVVASPLSFFLKLQILKINIVHIFQVHSHTNTVFTDWKLPNWVQDRCRPLLRRLNGWGKSHLSLNEMAFILTISVPKQNTKKFIWFGFWTNISQNEKALTWKAQNNETTMIFLRQKDPSKYLRWITSPYSFG